MTLRLCTLCFISTFTLSCDGDPSTSLRETSDPQFMQGGVEENVPGAVEMVGPPLSNDLGEEAMVGGLSIASTAGEMGGESAGEAGGESAGEAGGESAGEAGGETTEVMDRLGSQFSLYADEQWDQLKEVSLDQISSGTDCAAFVSAALRAFNFDVWAVYTDGLAPGDLPEQTLAYRLFELGFERYDNPLLLSAGDICFSQDAFYDGVSSIACEYRVSQRDGWFPTHTYIFMEWEIEGSTAWAWVVDNQGRRHLRNMTVAGPKDQFQYFMRYLGDD